MQLIVTTAKFRSVSQNSNEKEITILRNVFVLFEAIYECA